MRMWQALIREVQCFAKQQDQWIFTRFSFQRPRDVSIKVNFRWRTHNRKTVQRMNSKISIHLWLKLDIELGVADHKLIESDWGILRLNKRDFTFRQHTRWPSDHSHALLTSSNQELKIDFSHRKYEYRDANKVYHINSINLTRLLGRTLEDCYWKFLLIYQIYLANIASRILWSRSFRFILHDLKWNWCI